MNEHHRLPRKQIDLRKLPKWLQYLIALLAVVVIGTIAWFAGRGSPSPVADWINEHTALLGLIYIIAFVLVVARWILQKRRKKH